MIGRRIERYGEVSDLPAPHVLRWSAVLAFWVLLGAAGLFALRVTPTTLLGAATDDTAVTAVRVGIATVVPFVVLALVIHAQWRMRLEILAYAPGPLLIHPILDRTGDLAVGGDEGSTRETARAEAVRALLQRRLLDTQLQRSTAIPSSGGSSDFLEVVVNAGGKIEGFWGAFIRLARFLAPVSSYEVRCSILDPRTLDGGAPAETCVLLVELTRVPRIVVPPEIVRAASWEEATAAAGDWLVTTVLPRTRRCAIPPWTLRRNLKIRLELFQLYQRFRELRDEGDYNDALDAIDAAVQLDPTNLALRLEKGKLQEQMNDYLPALETYEGIIARAARLDRRLAYLRFGPPTRHEESGSITDSRWHDTRRGPGLDPRHPVVYTARYRYALLLGLGQEIAGQWCWVGENGDRYLALRHRFAETYREPAERLRTQFPRIFPAAPEEQSSEALIESILDVSRPCADPELRQRRIEVFLTSMGVWEVEHLIIERTGAASAFRYRRDHREIIPDRSLRLLLPRAVLRRALALRRCGVEAQRLKLAESSMIYPIDEPVVEPALQGLLEHGWPADGTKLAAFTRTVMGRRSGALRTWHVHYNAACIMATLLKEPTFTGPARRQVVRAIVAELEKSVACGDLGYIASTSEWVAEQDPDLAEVREEEQFKEFREQIFGRGPAGGS